MTCASATIALIALGANLPSCAGLPLATLRTALARLAADPDLTLTGVSRFWQSPAHPAGSGPDYLNGCARLETRLAAPELLARLHAVEAGLGRVRDGGRWQSRGIDLDLIACGRAVAPDAATQTVWRALPPARQAVDAPDRLILPHPRMQDRAFVLLPLAEIAPDWVHPLTGASVRQMAAALPEAARAGLTPLHP